MESIYRVLSLTQFLSVGKKSLYLMWHPAHSNWLDSPLNRMNGEIKEHIKTAGSDHRKKDEGIGEDWLWANRSFIKKDKDFLLFL